ncbi:family 78 glycoside hydrolase catalytic domain [Pelagicoccus albus]|uniref:family 78 glycoside hydrolase catalytic domain n=1 Tax=Pelagicoccus albus TaxID=415222 RepID=UPI001C8B14EC
MRVWDDQGDVSDWSPCAKLWIGISQSEWDGDWIGWDQPNQLELDEIDFGEAKWIWHPGGDAIHQAVFVGTLDIPANLQIEHAELALKVSGRYRFYSGPEQFSFDLSDSPEQTQPYVRDITERLRCGENRIYLWAERVEGEKAGVLFRLTVRLSSGEVRSLYSNCGWLCSERFQARWFEAETEAWPHAVEIGVYGDTPWGKVLGRKYHLPPAIYLRNEIQIRKPVRRATLFATALGCYDVHLNGERVNQSYFNPGWTDYRKRLYYQGYDVSEMLRQGSNAFGAVLADGWYSGYLGWLHQKNHYGKNRRFRCVLVVKYQDGEEERFFSDNGWKANTAGLLEADFLHGETYDARLSQLGWDESPFKDDSWQPVDCGAELNPVFEAYPGAPVVPLLDEMFKPVRISESSTGVFVADFGQNFTGVAEITIQNPKKGQRIEFRFGERLNEDGSLYTQNLRSARATDTYICRGDPLETWSPRFTFHGFQYVEVTGLEEPLTEEMIKGLPLSADCEQVGFFECSDEMLNKLARNIYWSQRSNFLEVPMDCPQRDERLGWCDGAQTFFGAAAYRADVQAFYRKWCQDLVDAQLPDGQFPFLAPLAVIEEERIGDMWAGSSPGWNDAGVICPWSLYEFYGDKTMLAKCYPSMLRCIASYVDQSDSSFLPPDGYRCLGDWLNHDADTPHDVIRTAYFAHSVKLVAQTAEVLGFSEDAETYAQLFGRIAEAFRKAYVDEAGRVKGDTQAAYALSIQFDLLGEEQLAMASSHLVRSVVERAWTPSTGLLVTLPLMQALSKINRRDVALKILQNDRFPSWKFSIRNGATTIWERWDSWTPEEGYGDMFMNSFNHFTLGGVYQWMAENIGGIRNVGIAFDEIAIAPCPSEELSFASFKFRSPRGLISVDWKVDNGGLKIDCQAPGSITVRLGDVDLNKLSEFKVNGSLITVEDGFGGEGAFSCEQSNQ